MFFIISFSFSSTSSNVHISLLLFWDISSDETATPPAFAAFAGANRISLSRNRSTASVVDGILAPSPTTLTPLSINVLAVSSSISFWVAHGNAISHGIDQIFEQSSRYWAFGCL